MAYKNVFLLPCLLIVSSFAQDHGQHQPAPAAPPPGRSGGGITLESLLTLARENNPTLRQAAAEVSAAEARERQAGALPNPTVGYVGEDIRGGMYRGGQHGFFVEQPFLLGGKLGAAKSASAQHSSQARLEADEQRMRVENGVRLLFYRALAAQWQVDLRAEMAALGNEAAAVTKQLANVGQADQTDLLQAEIEAQRLEMAGVSVQAGYQRAWRELVASVGMPALPMQRLAGSLESGWPTLDAGPWTQRLLAESPPAKIAQTDILRREAEVKQARLATVPDLRVRAGLLQNRELLESSRQPVGLQGFVEVGVQIPLFNRNRGGIAAAEAEVTRAEQEAKRTGLLLQQRSAPLWQEYETARSMADRYREQVLPRARLAAELMAKRYGEMAAAYPQVLVARRTALQLQMDYVSTLDRLWSSAIELESFMLTDALESPARTGEMDRSVREVNLPAKAISAERER